MRYNYFLKKDIFIFLSLVFIVWIIQGILLKPHLNYGFTPDDWWPLTQYKIGGFLGTWNNQGVYTSYQGVYINLLHNLFGFNFKAYQITNHTLKAISALVLFLPIVVVFKNRLLAFITVVLYAMAYSPIGTLELVVRGSDFIAITFMCIFFIAYYKTITKNLNDVKRLTGLTILLIITMFLSPIRIYPILFFILIIELYLIVEKRSKQVLFDSLKRVTFIFLPYIMLTVLSPSSVISFTVNAPAIISRILIGNWQLLLYPLGSFGSLFLLNDYWKMFGVVQTKSIFDYVGYLIISYLLVYFFITLFYSIILSIPSKRFFSFLLKVLSVGFIFQLIVFILFNHKETIGSNIRMGYDSVELYPVFLAIYILVLSFWVFREWVEREKRDKLLFALWLGPLFSFVFIFWTWIFKDWSVLFKGVHTYLNIPSIGSSLFIATTLILLYQKIKNTGIFGKQISTLTFLLLIPIFIINKNTIQNVWFLNNYSMDALEHELMRNRLWSKLNNFDSKSSSLFYFDIKDDYENGRFYEQSMLGRVSDWMYFKGRFDPKSCAVPLAIINNIEQLKSMMEMRNGLWGFSYHDFCNKTFFYPLQDFYAFKLMNKQPIDIKGEILKKLGITSN